MPNLTSVVLTGGAATAANGTVSTIDALMADGGQATIGAKADAASTATDVTPVSSVSIWKQISKSVQAIAASVAGSLPVTGTFWQATQPVSAASLPLPAGASTSALQTTANTSLATLVTNTPALGQALAASAVPIVLTTIQQTALTPPAAITGFATAALQPAINGDGGAQTHVMNFPATQPVSAVSLPLPALAATSTKQSDGTQKSQIVDGSGNVIASTSNALNVNITGGSSSGSVAQGSTTAGETGALIQGAVTTASPTYTTAQTSPLSLDTTGALRVNVTAGGAGGGVVTQSTGTNLHTVVDSSALPSGAATSALQTTGNSSLATLATNSPALGQALAAAAVPVVLTAIQQTALTPPAAITGFALEAGHLASLDTKTPSLGQALAASSQPVVLTAIQQTALTPPAAITGFALETGGNLATLAGTVSAAKVAVSIATAPVLVAGSALIGKVGIDQTTPGTTNKVSIGTDGTVALNAAIPAGANTIGAVNGNGATVEVIPTVTAGAYTAGFVIGGIETFANALPASFNGILQSITLKFKGTLQTTEFDVAIFSASPAGTFADHGAPAIATADSAILLGIYQMIAAQSELGTHTIYNLDGIGKQIVGASTSLYAVVTTKSIPAVNPASTSEMSLRLGVVW